MSDEIIEDTLEEAPAVEKEAPVEKSMDDTIRETFEAINKRGQGSEETEEQEDQRLRDEKGRFAKNQEAEQVEPAQAVVEDTTREQAPQQQTVVPPDLQRLGLRKEEAEAFAKADQVVRDAFVRRSEEMHRGFEQVKSKAQFGEQMERALQPYAATIQSFGVSPDVAAQKLFAADHALRYGSPQQKTQMLVQIAQQYGVDLNQATQYQADQPQIDPQIATLHQQINQMQSWIQQQAQAREQQERAALNSEIDRFRQDPAHSYFEDVKGDMAGLLQAGIASDLKDAYEKAIFANPTIRAQVLAKQQAEAEEKRRQEASIKAQAAKKAAAVNVQKKGVQPAAKQIGSMEDTIRAEAERLGFM